MFDSLFGFPDGLLTLTLILAALIALSGVISWLLARNGEPIDEVRELRNRAGVDDGRPD